jgi:hypothetical protein
MWLSKTVDKMGINLMNDLEAGALKHISTSPGKHFLNLERHLVSKNIMTASSASPVSRLT